jgi:hypothetical protein
MMQDMMYGIEEKRRGGERRGEEERSLAVLKGNRAQ